ncbi:SDR family NAD(P)-dependent oxidoreductase [Streptomyces orinoci]|uniref:SDR family NAD(P)-dependent oxidoreductase n=1 Tax=Streptomyces orinoci TaxID=67339 RepID=A0ABV3JQL4_STRON|nr:SDR family NAD(P)-dependent oxidoreductase [Streptomyces orinoci]
MADEPRVALVTGAGGAIGSAACRALAADGIRIAACYRTAEGAARALAAALPEAVALPLDVRDAAAVRAAFRATAEALGPVTVLVNAAGMRHDRPAARMRDEDWDEVIDTNLTGAFRCIRQALPHMLAARHGRIVSIGSAAAALGVPGQANYAAAKAGLLGMTRAVARETGRHGITANVVSPGLVASRLTADVGGPTRTRYLQLTATGALVSAEDVAAAVRHCVNNPAMTGQLIHIDGGL